MFTVLPEDGTIADLATTVAERFTDRDGESVMFFLSVARATDELRNVIEAWFRAHGVSQGRFAVLMSLSLRPDEGFTPSEIAERVSSTRATITGLATGLERDGYVTREAAPGDRRKVILKLTDAGRDLLEALVPAHLRRLAHLLANVTPEERATTMSVVQRMRAAAPSLPD